MRVINGKIFHKEEMRNAIRIDNDGWDYYDGQNKQWYSLFYNPDCGYVHLNADNSGSCNGDYSDEYFDSPKAFARWCKTNGYDWEELLGEIDEADEAAVKFASEILS